MPAATDEPSIANESGPTTRLVIADDHDLIRSGLRSMLDRQADLEVVGEAANGREAVELCRELRPDLVLMDVRMPEMDGLEATREIKVELPRIGVLIVTSYEDPDYLFEALKAGAAGYVLKNASQQELISTVRKVVSGESPLDPRLASRLLKRLAGEMHKEPAREEPTEPERREAPPLSEPLTPRETEALRLLARGQSNREIAQNMLVSVGTAKIHVRRILAKLEVSDRIQAAVRAVELGLLPPEG